MTTPAERTRSISGARRFLESVAEGISDVDARLVRTLAMSLLRHFPSDTDISASSAVLPSVWAIPQHDLVAVDTKQVEQKGTLHEVTGATEFSR
ncbi:BPSL0761 family protein [Paraburkholderia bryophila]|uniref:Uncharacterized protein n=1 Tax=Paraburkholderia bryophila TaxID=420952 RepID=A0A329CN55_9BURK|nr:BPSL0761 family protein [Paraburkholderia bryophila]RAS33184.1 hypothetical protein BX591_107101 [Paraburkholderia bryophila]